MKGLRHVGTSGTNAIPWRYLGLGFFWACSMLTFRSSILLVGEADTPELNTLIVIVSFLANVTVLLGVSALVEKAPSSLARLSPWLFCASIIVGLSLIHLAGHLLSGMALLFPLLLGAVLAGVGYGYFWGSWADALGRVHPSRTVLLIPAAFLLTTALFLAISLTAPLFALCPLAPIIALPVVSTLCLQRCRQEEPQGKPLRTESATYLAALTSLVPLIIAALVFSCLFGFMWETAVLSARSATVAHELPLLLNLAAAVLLMVFVAISRRRINLSLAYQILIPISIVVFAALPFFWQVHPVVLNAVMSAAHGVFDVIIWYLVASTAYDFAVSGFVVGGVVRALSVLARLVGIGIGYLAMISPDVADGAVIGIGIGAVYLLVMLLWFLWHSSKRHQPHMPVRSSASEPAVGKTIETLPQTADSAPGPAASNHTDIAPAPSTMPAETSLAREATESAGSACTDDLEPSDQENEDGEEVFALIAEDYGLTRREAEVLPYLAKGRSAKVIADALFVSESTIRTHTRRILEKTCLHSKQELIDLVDSY